MKNEKTNESIINDYDYLGNSASAMDCTGLIPSAPQSEAELDSYEAVYHFEPPKVKAAAPSSALSQEHPDGVQ